MAVLFLKVTAKRALGILFSQQHKCVNVSSNFLRTSKIIRRTTKIIFAIGLVLLIYGYLSREFKLYFFWDSKAFGWAVLFIGLLFYLIDLNRSRKSQGKKTIWVKIGIALIIFGFIVSTYVIFNLHKSEPYKIATDYLKTNSQLKEEVGNINGFGLIPTGSVQIINVNGAESGRATFVLTVFGDKKYKDIDINLRKTSETDWTVTSVY